MKGMGHMENRRRAARRKRALEGVTLVEVLITLLILAAFGGVAVAALWMFIGGYSQSSDYVTARQELEMAFQRVGDEITNIALGMPNNRQGDGDFAESFRAASSPESRSPVMGMMGRMGEAWGGPLTLRLHPDDDAPDYANESLIVKKTLSYGSANVYVGDELLYAWAVPATIGSGRDAARIKVGNQQVGEFSQGDARVFTVDQPGALQALADFRYKYRPAGIVAGNGTPVSPRSWIVFPGLHVPLLIEGWRDAAGNTRGGPEATSGVNTLTLRMAPGSRIKFNSFLSGFEEIHLVQACRIYVNKEGDLVQETYNGDYRTTGKAPNAAGSHVDTLAHNVANVCFMFEPEGRLLTMYLAVRGGDADPIGGGGGAPSGWPSVPDPETNSKIRLPVDDSSRRVLIGSRTWRIRN